MALQKITQAGAAARVAAELAGQPFELANMVLGSGQLESPLDAENAVALSEFQTRIPITGQRQGITPQQQIMEAVVPVSVGGFDLQEIGLETPDNTLYAYATVPLKRLPANNDGTSRLSLEFVLEDTNSDDLAVTIDDSAVYATKRYVDGELAKVRNRVPLSHRASGNISTLNRIRLSFNGDFEPDAFYLHQITIELDLVLAKILNTFYELRVNLSGPLGATDYRTFSVNAIENDDTSLDRTLTLHYQTITQGQPDDLLTQCKLVRYKSFANSSDDGDNVEQTIPTVITAQSLRL